MSSDPYLDYAEAHRELWDAIVEPESESVLCERIKQLERATLAIAWETWVNIDGYRMTEAILAKFREHAIKFVMDNLHRPIPKSPITATINTETHEHRPQK